MQREIASWVRRIELAGVIASYERESDPAKSPRNDAIGSQGSLWCTHSSSGVRRRRVRIADETVGRRTDARSASSSPGVHQDDTAVHVWVGFVLSESDPGGAVLTEIEIPATV